ncbi:DUF1499 domain-containing protein [Rhodomicrobium sp. Az07]|uniref:DUF1499 domain-containing protein n=1 Tax=Rhodomicrobium sp. Az07 TaxID=2839034 RepID=UPI001BEBC798|nr:DUF1499 domain-containing protein [Rhodomicrobium sp. Az07]MBT3070420.1 DUF1499 domain-containing protein [Rhodomicrobium sp. Az07]
MRLYETLSRRAVWSYRIAALSVLVFAGGFIWHRFFGLATPLAFKIMGAAIAGAIIAAVLAVAALVAIWKDGDRGAGRATAALFFAALVLAAPLWSLPALVTLPRLYEVTSDPAAPLAFDRVARIRQGQANPVRYETAFAPLQAQAYPDVKPLIVQRPLVDVYTSVRDVVKTLDWQILEEQAPEARRAGRIEAVDKTLLFGFLEDVVIRVTGNSESARVDIRSSSRFGQHDLGRNAERVRRFMAEVKSRLAALERLERMERVVAARQAEEKEKAKPGTGSRKRDNN